MSIPVATLGVPAECVTALEQSRGAVTVVRRCATLNELAAAGQAGMARAVVIGDGADVLSASLLERFHGADVAVIALVSADAAVAALTALGVRCVPADEAAGTLPEVVESVAGGSASLASAPTSSYSDPGRVAAARRDADEARLRGGTAGEDGPRDSSHGGRFTAAPPGQGGPGTEKPDAKPPNAENTGTEARTARKAGKVIAVWGPAGAPGRTTIAVNLAAEFAAAGQSVLLVDADTYGASVAVSLGLLDESAGFAQACRLAEHGLLDMAALERVSARVAVSGAHVRVLTGITRPERWAELRGAAVAAVLESARAAADITVVDCGFCLEADEELSFDTAAPRRNAATLRTLELADTIYAVGAADAIGVPRLVRALAELEQAVPSAVPAVLLNKVRSRSVGRMPERALRDAWQRFGPRYPISAFLPDDSEAADAALLGGTALLESAPQSPLRTAISVLAAPPAQARSGHPRRRPVRPFAAKVKFSGNGARLVGKGPQRSGL